MVVCRVVGQGKGLYGAFKGGAAGEEGRTRATRQRAFAVPRATDLPCYGGGLKLGP